MNWSRFTLPLTILLLMVSCGQWNEQVSETPTPFSSVGTTLRAPVGEPIAISLANLAANPELFEGANLRLRGQYQSQPRLICEQDAFPSPATWGLVGEGLLANATGHDQQLRELIAIGQEITVEGRWLRYLGPIGCGKSAPVQEVWYLSTSRIVDPHPLARSGQAVSAAPPEATVITNLPVMVTAIEGEGEPELVETVILTVTESAGPTFVPSATPFAPSPVTATVPPPLAVTLTPSPPSATQTPAQTGTLSATPTASPTSESGAETPTATATLTSQDPITKGQLDYEDLIMGKLAADSVDAWNVDLSGSESITITVSPAFSENVVVSVLDANGQTIVDRQDQATIGEIETIQDLDVADTDSIQIQITSDNGNRMDYALMVMDEISYNFTFEGTLDPGTQRTSSLAADNDHFWFFNAVDGETINLRITPNGDADAYVELLGPDSALIQSIDNNGSGEAEILDNYSILATGLYGIRVGEFEFASMTYQVLMDKP